jgi:hypothetical protein
MNHCKACEKEVKGYSLCVACSKSYDRHTAKDSSIMGVIDWATRRARNAERKRAAEIVRALGRDNFMNPGFLDSAAGVRRILGGEK